MELDEKIQSSTQFSSDESYYEYLSDILDNIVEHKNKDLGRKLIDIIKNENILPKVKNIPFLDLRLNFSTEVRGVVFYLENRDDIMWLINTIVKGPSELQYKYYNLWFFLDTSYGYNNIDLLISILIEMNYDLLELLLNMRPVYYHINRNIPDAGHIVLDYVDMHEVVKMYNEGKGNDYFKYWFREVVINQV